VVISRRFGRRLRLDTAQYRQTPDMIGIAWSRP
jgi:hypothetical protein